MIIDHCCDIHADGLEHLSTIGALLSASQRTVVVAHQNADGDAVGSVVAWTSMLRRHTAAQIDPLLPDGCPSDLDWLPLAADIVDGSAQPDEAATLLAEADVVVCSDFNTLSRTGCLQEALATTKAKKILIDHHRNPEVAAFDIVVSDHTISSACELGYWVMRAIYGCNGFDTEAAMALYTGMRTDTGGMAFSNGQPSLYLATAHLVQCGIDASEINRNIANVFSPNRMRFWGYAMKDLLEIDSESGTALLPVSLSDMEAYGMTPAELTGLINDVMRIKDVECAVLVREEETRVRLSYRSKTTVNVDEMARALFAEAGGHLHAAGATSTLPFADTVAEVRNQLKALVR
ncbi:MAG: DHH family phosphoesterase [Bacteroidales bacterium]|nr:DHH family phosphoesterase [Bacteroidales bacterium]